MPEYLDGLLFARFISVLNYRQVFLGPNTKKKFPISMRRVLNNFKKSFCFFSYRLKVTHLLADTIFVPWNHPSFSIVGHMIRHPWADYINYLLITMVKYGFLVIIQLFNKTIITNNTNYFFYFPPPCFCLPPHSGSNYSFQ